MTTGADRAEGRGFRFLFRTDQGMVDRATWWWGTVPIVAIGALAAAGWVLVRPYTHDALQQPPLLALFAYLYLLAFTFLILLLLICEYNLSAKRFAARGRPRALAAILPATFLFAGALAWYVPRSDGLLPGWATWVGAAAVLGVAAWFVIDLGMSEGVEPRNRSI